MTMGAGVYVSIPFCKAKCSFCNFASGVFGVERMGGYLDRVGTELREVRDLARGLGVRAPEGVDTVYFGGGTPSLMEPEMVERVMGMVREEFAVAGGAEFTVECAPGQMSDAGLESWLQAGLNRVSFGVQSFVDTESAAVGRTHTGAECRREIGRMQRAGVSRVGLDLICGLPGQTFASWEHSVREAIACRVEHVSVYMLEVDEGSRLGREKIAGGVRYGAGSLATDDEVADWYRAGCEWLGKAGLPQYEISNFGARPSVHNCKYWRREEYLGFGLDAHSMLRDGAGAVRWANGDRMEQYGGTGLEARAAREVTRVSAGEGFEEAVFLGLRMCAGVSLAELRREFGEVVDGIGAGVGDCVEAGLMGSDGEKIWLTGSGRVCSSEVFGRLLVGCEVAA